MRVRQVIEVQVAVGIHRLVLDAQVGQHDPRRRPATPPANPVGIAGTVAFWAVTVPAALAGAQLGHYLRPHLLKWASVILFAVVGVVVLASALMVT